MSTRPFRCSLCYASFVSRNDVRIHKLTCTGRRTSPQRDSPPQRHSRGFVGSYANENLQILKDVVEVCEGYKSNSNPPQASSSLAHDHTPTAAQPHSNPDEIQATVVAPTVSEHITTPTAVHADGAILRVTPMFNIDDPQNILNYSHQAIPDLALAHNNNSNECSPREDDDASFSQVSTTDDDDGMSWSQESHEFDNDAHDEDDGDDAPSDEDFDPDALAAIAGEEDGFSIPSTKLGILGDDEQQVGELALVTCSKCIDSTYHTLLLQISTIRFLNCMFID